MGPRPSSETDQPGDELVAKEAARSRTSEIQELSEAIVRHKRLYDAGQPEITDQAFDRLEDRLRTLSPQHPALSVIGQPAVTGKKVAHDQPMLSLAKTYVLEELLAWAGALPVVGSWKVDGVALSLIFTKGKLVLGKTRGNGRVGEDVTEKLRWVPDLIQELGSEEDFEIRGELYCHEHNFGKLALTMESLGLERPTSPRNIVAGLLGRKTQVDLMRFFNFFAYDVASKSGTEPFATEMQKFGWLSDKGFATPNPKLLTTAHAIKGFLEDVRNHLASSEIGLDGAVLAYNDCSTHGELGATAHHPRYKMCFKWPGETAVAVVRKILWDTSRFGNVTPVAVIDPVNLSGAQITNITLHNADHVRAYNLKPGDTIEVIRSGEVIPKFLRVVTPQDGHYVWPATCPACGEGLEFDEVRLKCPNTLDCPAQKLLGILNWIRAAAIDDLSEKRLEQMMDAGMVGHPAALYSLSIEDLLKLPLTKQKMAQKLYDNIQKSRSLPLARFLMGLGIEGGGMATWEKILEHYPTLDKVLAASEEDIVAIQGFAAKSAGQIVSGLRDKGPEILALLRAGVEPRAAAPRPGAQGILVGRQVAITGSLSRPRAEVEEIIKAAGGKPSSTVTAKTYCLVTNEVDSQSSKMIKARELGIPIWSEEKLVATLGG